MFFRNADNFLPRFLQANEFQVKAERDPLALDESQVPSLVHERQQNRQELPEREAARADAQDHII